MIWNITLTFCQDGQIKVMEQVEHVYIYIYIEMTYVKTPLGRPKLIYENNMTVDLAEMGSEYMNWTGPSVWLM